MALKVDIYAKNMEAGERVTEYINKKVSKLERYINDIDEIRVDLSFVKSARSSADRHVAQITIRGKGFILRSEERSDDIFAAIDTTLEKIERQIARFKGKRAHGRGDGVSASELVAEKPATEEVEAHVVIARRKQFTLVPMDEIEAMEQMALLGHENFFIFYNANTSSVNVLYCRRDGTYGLIEPSIG